MGQLECSQIGEGELETLRGIRGTRYTYTQLEPLTREVVRKGFINRPLPGGYPILHVILIERRDAKEGKQQYLDLFRGVLSQTQADKNIRNKHGTSLLSVSVEEEDEEALDLLLANKADPAYISRDGKTAFEHALDRGSSVSIIGKLGEVTPVTPAMGENFKTSFEQFLEEWNVEGVTRFLDLKLVNPEDFARHPERSRISTEIDRLFDEGFWIRVLGNPGEEVKVLGQREGISSAALAQMRHSHRKDGSYTDYSPATFVRREILISLFPCSSIGVMIRPTNRIIPYWYDGHNEQLTRGMDFSKEKLDNGQREGQFWEVKEAVIAATLQRMKEKDIEEKVSRVQEEGGDKHGVFRDQRFQRGRQFSWNEGLFRYKREDVFAIYVPDEAFLERASAFRTLLQLEHLPFLSYEDGVLRVYSIRG